MRTRSISSPAASVPEQGLVLPEARRILEVTVFGHQHMHSFGGATGWVNSEPLGPAELAGRVVLVNFWTLTCINWLRTEPYVRAWSQAYRNDGLVVIGVHTPEFSFDPRSTGCARRRAIGGSTTRSHSTTTTRCGRRSTTTTGRRSTSSTGTASSATTTSAKSATSRRSASSRSFWGSTATSSPSRWKGSGLRRRPTGTTCAHRRRTWAPGAASTSRRRAAP